MHFIDLNKDALKMLDTHFSYNKKMKKEITCFKGTLVQI